MRLFTIGFTKKSAQHFFEVLQDAHVLRIVDVRLNNVSQLAGFAKRDDLQFLLREVAKIEYIHLLDLAPDSQMLRAFRGSRLTWSEYADAYLTLLSERDVINGQLMQLRDHDCLLCSEATPEECHRRLAAEFFAKCKPDVEITHLV